MRKFILFNDPLHPDECAELSPLTFDEFDKLGRWSGANDIAFREWLLATRNEKRAELEAKHGYDTKHAMHLVRLMRMCREILELGRVIVKRADREELLAIRNGAWTYEQLVEWAAAEDRALTEVYQRSTLRHASDRETLDRLCVEVVESMP